MLPKKITKKKAPSAFTRALRRFRDRQAEEQITAGPHTRKTIQRCAVTGQQQVTTWHQRWPGARWTVAAISPLPAKQAGEGKIGWSRSGRQADETVFQTREFDHTDLTCACCGHEERFVHCHKCQELACGGAITFATNGRRVFHCHQGCGNHGYIDAAAPETITGNENQGKAKSKKALPRGKTPAAISAPNKLIGNKRR